jgi:hypothetical protein
VVLYVGMGPTGTNDQRGDPLGWKDKKGSDVKEGLGCVWCVWCVHLDLGARAQVLLGHVLQGEAELLGDDLIVYRACT